MHKYFPFRYREKMSLVKVKLILIIFLGNIFKFF